MVSPMIRRSPRRATLPINDMTDTCNERDKDIDEIQQHLAFPSSKMSVDVDPLSSDSDNIAKAFTFLSSQNRTTLRNIGRHRNCRGTGNKKELLYRNMIFLLNGKRAGRDISYMLKENRGSEKFEEFVRRWEDRGEVWKEPPSETEIREHLRSFGDPEDQPSHAVNFGTTTAQQSTQGTPYFSISEFARLFAMLRDDFVCKEALLKLTQELKRADFENGRSRNSFWKEIGTRFNDSTLKYTQPFEGSVPEADSAAAPLFFRSFDVLKSQMHNARKLFTLVHSNYTQSGQNDPEKWPELLKRDNRGELLAASKQCYIIFLVCRLDQSYGKEMFLLNATVKTFAGGDDEGPGDDGSTASSGTKRKRISSDSFHKTMEKRWDGVEKFMNAVTKQGEAFQETMTSQQQDGASNLSTDFAQFAEKNSILQIVMSAYKTYREAEDCNADPVLISILKRNYEKVRDKFRNVEEEHDATSN